MVKTTKPSLEEEAKHKQTLFTLAVADVQFYKVEIERILESTRLIERLSKDSVVKKLCKNIRDDYNLDVLIHHRLATELLDNITTKDGTKTKQGKDTRVD